MEPRADLYQHLFTRLLTAWGAPMERFRFSRGTDFQLKQEFALDLYRMVSLVPERPAFDAAGLEGVEHPQLSQLILPLMLALNEHYLEADLCLYGAQNRASANGMFSARFLEIMGYKAALATHHEILSSLTGQGKMSGEGESCLGVLDNAAEAKKKLKKAFCEPQNVTVNPILEIVGHVLLGENKGDFPVLCKISRFMSCYWWKFNQ